MQVLVWKSSPLQLAPHFHPCQQLLLCLSWNEPQYSVHWSVTPVSYNSTYFSGPQAQFEGAPMATVATTTASTSAVHDKFAKGPGLMGTLIFVVVLIVGVSYIGYSLSRDLVDLPMTFALPYILLGVALFVALAFEFVNRLSLQRKRRGHRHLYALAGPAHRRRVERLFQLPRRGHFHRHRGVRHHLAAARRTDFAGWQQCRLRNGVCPSARGGSVEPRQLLFPSAGL